MIWGIGILEFPLLKGALIAYVPVAVGIAAACLLLNLANRGAIQARLDAMKPVHFWVLGLGVAAILRIGVLVLSSTELTSDVYQYHRLAVGLLES